LTAALNHYFKSRKTWLVLYFLVL